MLVAVLVVLALMAAVVGTASLAARGAAGTARLSADRLQADAMAEAGVALAGFALFAEGMSAAALDGRTVAFSAGVVRLSASSEAARIDLNAATPQLLSGLWLALGRSGIGGDDFAEAVGRWRRGDSAQADPLPTAAETEADPGAAARRFQTVGALAAVEGVDKADVGALAPYVTVFNPAGNIDPLVAPRPVLEALPGANSADVEAILSLRAAATGAADDDALVGQVRALVPSVAGRLSAGARAYRVRVEVRHRALAPFVVEAVVARGVNPARLYHVLSWWRPS